jgi:putative hemolysin
MFRKPIFALLALMVVILCAACAPGSNTQQTNANTPEANIANPASVNCEQNGGTLEIRTDSSGGQTGFCHFPDGSQCEEWAYFRGECSPGDSLNVPTATETPSEKSAALPAAFPLAVGASWKYSAEISYQDPADATRLVTWTGFITDTVTASSTAPDGSMVFTLQEDMQPLPPQQVWRQPRAFEYTVSTDAVLDGERKILQFPLADGSQWEWMPAGGYQVSASFMGNVSTPYGELEGCYSILLVTNPDTTQDTFCPGTGFAAHSYQHHGTPQNETLILVSYTPGVNP